MPDRDLVHERNDMRMGKASSGNLEHVAQDPAEFQHFERGLIELLFPLLRA